jgi:hypothetical protein
MKQRLWLIQRSASGPGKYRLANAHGMGDVTNTAYDSPRSALADAVRQAGAQSCFVRQVVALEGEWALLLDEL